MKHASPTGLTLLLACLLANAAGAHLSEKTKLLPSDGAPGDRFGTAVSIDGPTAVVGAPLHLVSGVRGAVYVYQRNTETSWPEVAKLTPTGAGPADYFGGALSIAGPYLGVGAPKASSDQGVVYVFNGFGASWTQVDVLSASDKSPGHNFGRALVLEGDTLVVGAPGNEAAYVFRLVAGTWVEEQKLTHAGGLAGDLFGTSVALFGDELVVGAPGDDTDAMDAGSAYLFQRSGSTWTETFRFGSLTPGAGDAFGKSVCIGLNYAGMGAPDDDDFGLESGAAHYFSRDGLGGWISEGTLVGTAAPTFAGDHLGSAIGVDTNLFVVGQPNGDLQGLESGGAQTFLYRLGAFHGDVMFPTDTGAGDALGTAVAISGCWMLCGTPLDDDLGENSGSAYVFLGTPYSQYYCLPGLSAKGCAATLSTIGSASATATSGFTVTADGVETGITGLYFYGTSGPQEVPWGNGTSYQCVIPPVIRMGAITSTGPTGACAGTFSQDLNATWCSTCPLPLKNPGAGNEIFLQLWYRDPNNTSNQSTALSNAASIGICP